MEMEPENNWMTQMSDSRIAVFFFVVAIVLFNCWFVFEEGRLDMIRQDLDVAAHEDCWNARQER